MTKKATVTDIAREAGVSVGTVSRVFNGHNVKPEIKRIVIATADTLEYEHNALARGVKRNNTATIGIYINDYMFNENLWSQKIVMALIKTISEYGYRNSIRTFSELDKNLLEASDLFDGLIFLWGTPNKTAVDHLNNQKRKMPVVTYPQQSDYKHSVCVTIDQQKMVKSALSYLLASGHKKIANIIHGKADSSNSYYHHYETSLAEFGHRVNNDLFIDITRDSSTSTPAKKGFTATLNLLKKQADTDAIIFSSDVLAAGGLEAIKQSGKSVPDDISIISMDDTSASQVVFPAISSIGSDARALAVTIIENLERLLVGRKTEPLITLTRELILRESVKAK